MKTWRLFILFPILAALLAGCGGGSKNGNGLTGRATFTVKWPIRSKLIPVASNSINVTVLRKGAVVATQLIPRPVTGNTTSVVFNSLPVDQLVANAVAFPNADGTGVAQAQGTAALPIQANQNTTITLTMDSTITQLVIAPVNPLLIFGDPLNNNVTLFATAMNSNGDVVLTSPSTFAWTNDNPKLVTLTPTGSMATALGIGIGRVNIGVTEQESGKSASTTVIIRGSGIEPVLIMGRPKFRVSLQNTGVCNVTPNTNIGGNELWNFTAGGPVESSPVINASGTVFVGSSDGNVTALDPLTGAVKWQTNVGGRVISTPALGTDSTVYVFTAGGVVSALAPSDGSTKWSISLFNASFTSSPTIGADGTLYAGAQDGNVYAINGSTGDVLWTFGTGGAIESSPALSGDKTILYIGSGDKNMYAIRIKDHTQVWSFPTNGSIKSSPAVDSSGNLYFGSDDGNVYALNSAGTKIWQFATQGAVDSSPALFNVILRGNNSLTILIGSSDRKLYALDSGSGMPTVTPFQTGGSIRSSPTVTDNGQIVVGSDDLNVYFLGINANGFHLLGSPFKTNGAVSSSGVIGPNGTTYIGSNDLNLYALVFGG